jgi:FAD/FMN-containing dehydrogenase
MRQCSVNVEALEATVSGGVTVADLNAAAGRHALAAVIGNDGAVSMAGLLLGGGYGPLMTRFGLASDSLISAEIVGGESGPRARHMNPEWAIDVRNQCLTARVPFFFKQWGGRSPKTGGRLLEGQALSVRR